METQACVNYEFEWEMRRKATAVLLTVRRFLLNGSAKKTIRTTATVVSRRHTSFNERF